MSENKKILLKVLFLSFIITGALTFLYSMFYWDELILYVSLIQLMSGSVGMYLMDKPPKYPYNLKRLKT